MWKHASINRAYRLVWSRVQQAFVPAPETARGHSAGSAVARSSRASACLPPRAHPRWRLLSLALAGAFLAHPALALDAGALPTGGSVAAGTANITGSGNALTITQDSDRAIVNWQSFDVGANASVRFAQPSTTAATLNRVTGSGASQILGTMTANGQVYLVNPAGVLFGAGAQVNVGSLVASTLRIADADFLAGRDRFALDGATGEVSNQGSITAADGGRVALLGARVSNTGTILAPLGDVALAAGRQITLSAGANGHLQIAVDPADVATLASNGGLIQADGGQVILTAQGADALASAVVSHTGTIQARTVATREGRILLLANLDRGGTTEVAGTLDASAPQGGNGGFIETSAARVSVADSATVTTRAGNGTTGTWLIDPNDFTIAATGGDMTGAKVSEALQNTGFEIQSVRGSKSGKGDIFVNDTVNWRANTLTLTAERDIQINAAMNGSEAAGLALRYGQGAPAADNTATYQVRAPVNLASTGRFSTTLGSDGATINYTIITGLGEQGSITGKDLQGINGDLGGRYVLGNDIDARATREWDGGAGFDPLGEARNYFTGTFDGLGHVISQLTVNRPDQDYAGLFGAAQNAVIRNVGLDGVSVSGKSQVAGLVGQVSVGEGAKASLDNAWVSGSVSGIDYVGGLVGDIRVNGGTINLNNAYATSAVKGGGNYVGGLVGYSTVVGSTTVGGTASISNVYATGAVEGANYVGGLVGFTLADKYSTASISNAYATGAVTGPPRGFVGGFVGYNADSSISNSYWDSYSTKQSLGVGTGGSGNLSHVTSANNQFNAPNYAFKASAYANLGTVATSKDAGAGWYMIDGQTRPFLASEYSTTVTNAHQLQLMAMDLGANYTLARDIDAGATGVDSWGRMWNMPGFSPIGRSDNAPFKGTFDGQGHVVSKLTIKRSSENLVGLFGVAKNAAIRNVGLDNVSISGDTLVGGLVGNLLANDGKASLDNVWSRGVVSGKSYVGGLVGQSAAVGRDSTANINNASAAGEVTGQGEGQGSYVGGLVGSHHANANGTVSISNAHATVAVKGNDKVGGLVGRNSASGGTANIRDAFATGNVSGAGGSVGGLAGENYAGSSSSVGISNAYATGNVSGTDKSSVGGLVGLNFAGTNSTASLSNTYATGNVSGAKSSSVGGLAGANQAGNTNSTARISQAYATGAATGGANSHVGGLVGDNFVNSGTASISEAHATGAVTGHTRVGGLVGNNSGTIEDAWASGDVSGATNVGSLVGDQWGTIRNSSYRLTGDRTLRASEGDINLLGGVVQGDGVVGRTLNVTASKNANLGDIQLPDNHLNLDIAGNITAADAVSVDRYTLNAGHWRQIGTLPALSASDFRLAGGTFVRATGGDGSAAATPYLLTDVYGLQGISTLLSGHFALAGDIDASHTAGWNEGAGFSPIGRDESAPFTGTLDGQSHVISGLTIYRPNQDLVGLFSAAENASIRNVGLDNANVTGSGDVGALVGQLRATNNGTASIDNAWASGTVNGVANVGGLVGSNQADEGSTATISNAYATGTVTGKQHVGGLVGVNVAIGGTSRIRNAQATGAVTGLSEDQGEDQGDYVGGLVGINVAVGGTASISNAYATGAVTGNGKVGGLVGANDALIGTASISNAYATGAVEGNDRIGGLVGSNGGTIEDTWASGDVSGATNVGSLVGQGENASLIRSSYVLTDDRSISASEGDINLLGGVTQDAGTSGRTLTVKAGGNANLGAIQLPDNHLNLDIAGNITAADAVTVDRYTLNAGHWRQIGTLPALSARDFRLAGGTFVRATDGDGSAATPYLLTDVYGLQGMGTLLSGHFALAGDIDASGTAKWNDRAGFSPIGRDGITPFKGTFDGRHHVISGLTINRHGQEFVGLFGAAQNATIRNVGLDDANITGNSNVGALVGQLKATNSDTASIDNAWASGTVNGSASVGGLVGVNIANGGTASISNAHATGNVTGTGTYNFGGLVGYNYADAGGTANISSAYATGAVTGKNFVGGLAGQNVADSGSASISSAYATGTVTSNDAVTGASSAIGGLVGINHANNGGTVSISDAYATGTVEGDSNVGGLVGRNDGTVKDAWASGDVSGVTNVGSLVGTQGGSIRNSGYRLTGDRTISAARGDVNLLGGVTQGTGTSGQTLTVTATRGNASLGTIELSGNHLSLNVAGNITAPDKVEVSRYTLNAGHWRQIGTLPALPTFSASDFRLAGGTFVRATGGDGSATTPYLLTDVYGLQGMGSLLGGHFVLGDNIDAGASAAWNDGAGFAPIGSSAPFTGSLDGQGHIISNLTINTPNRSTVGLFSKLQGARISNLGLVNATVTANTSAGALAGTSRVDSVITGVYSRNGTIQGKGGLGGLVGNNLGTISNSYADGVVTGSLFTFGTGGLVGQNAGSVENSYATGTVTANSFVGGLVGTHSGGIISNSYATATVNGDGDYARGLVGSYVGGAIQDSFWNMDLAAIGVGAAPAPGASGKTGAQLMNLGTYAGWDIDNQGGTGSVWRIYDGDTMPLLRSFLKPVTVTASGMDGKVYDGTAASGTFAYTTSIADARLDGAATYGTRSANAGRYAAGLGLDTGLYSGQSGYDIIYADNTVTIDKTPLTITALDKGKVYDGLIYTGGYDVRYDGFVHGETKAALDGTLAFGGNAQEAFNAGDYTITAKDLSARNYDVRYVNGTLTIDKAPLTITANSGRSTYGDTPSNPGFTAVGLVNAQDVGVLGDLANSFGIDPTTNADEYVLTVSGTLTNGNYRVALRDGRWIVDPKAITVTANSGRSIYGDAPTNPGLTAEGLVNGQNIGVLAGLTNSFGIDHDTDAGRHTLRVDGTLTNGNYIVTERNDGTWGVDPRQIAVTANGGLSTYGDTNQINPGLTANGLVNEQDVSVLTGLTNSFGINHGTNAGSHTLRVNGTLTNGNYLVTESRDGTWIVDPARLLITANNATRIANGIPYQGGNGVGYTGFVNGEDASVLEGALAYGGSAQGATRPGVYGLTAEGLRSGNYRIDYRDGSLTIGAAQGMITAGQLENSAIDARYAARHDTPFGPRPSRLVSLSQPDRAPSRLPLSFAENFIRVEP